MYLRITIALLLAALPFASVDFDSAWTQSSTKKKHWHRWTLTVSEEARVVRWEHENGRWAEFKLDEPTVLRGTRHGVGVFGGVGYFRNVESK